MANNGVFSEFINMQYLTRKSAPLPQGRYVVGVTAGGPQKVIPQGSGIQDFVRTSFGKMFVNPEVPMTSVRYSTWEEDVYSYGKSPFTRFLLHLCVCVLLHKIPVFTFF